jgi:hypothetical protein
MVALRHDVDALGRTADERRLVMLRSNADIRLLQAGWAEEDGNRERAEANGRLAMLHLAERADIFARRDRFGALRRPAPCLACEEDDQACEMHSVACPCAHPGGCIDICVCWGEGVRGSFAANLDCSCRDFEYTDEDYEDERADRSEP